MLPNGQDNRHSEAVSGLIVGLGSCPYRRRSLSRRILIADRLKETTHGICARFGHIELSESLDETGPGVFKKPFASPEWMDPAILQSCLALLMGKAGSSN